MASPRAATGSPVPLLLHCFPPSSPRLQGRCCPAQRGKERAACIHLGLPRITRGCTHGASPSKAPAPAGAAPQGAVCCHEMVSISEGFAPSSVQVEERPRGQLSASSHPQTTGLKASHVATLALSQGQRDSAHLVAHLLPRVFPATLPSPSGLPPPASTQERRGDALSQSGSSSPGLSGQWGRKGSVAVSGSGPPRACQGQSLPELQRRVMHSKSPRKCRAGRGLCELGAPSRGLDFLLSVKAAVCTRDRP